jgi:homoserine dehydrogenase
MIQQPNEAVSKTLGALESPSEEMAELIFLTHEALERNVNQAIAAIEALPFVRSNVTLLRMESLT